MRIAAFSITGSPARLSDSESVSSRAGQATTEKASPGAWEQLIRQYGKQIYAVCYRFAGSPDKAEDLQQEAFIKIFENIDRFDPSRGSFSTWVMSVLKNLLIDDYRKRRIERQLVPIDVECDPGEPRLRDTIVCSKPGPEVRAERKERARILRCALACLPSHLREPVVLKDIYDRSYEEIGSILDVPVGTVKSRISRGRAELIRVLKRFRLPAH